MVADRGKIEQIIQVCYDLSNPKTKDREIRGLINASIKFRCDNLILITFENQKDIEHGGKTIKVIDASDWLLTED